MGLRMRAYLLASLLLPLAACADPDPGPEPTELTASRDAWEAARDDAADSYSYVRWTEYWPSRRLETTIVVSSGTVIERSHVEWDNDAIVTEYSEYGADVGTAEVGFPAVTLDALYDECANDVVPRSGGDIELTFRTFEDGLLQDCFTADQSVDDGANDGIQLQSISFELSCGARGVPCG